MGSHEPSPQDQVRTHVGHQLSDIGERALSAFFELPGVQNIVPAYPGQSMRVLDIGLPFALLGNTPSARALKQHLANKILLNGLLAPADSEWSEVQVGALMRHFGANVEFVKRVAEPPGQRTPDVRARWSATSVADIEVTRAEPREPHTQVRDNLAVLSEAIRVADFSWHLLALFSDGRDQESLIEALAAITRLMPSESEERPGRWFVRAFPANQREIVTGNEAITLYAPKWWPKDAAGSVVDSTVIGAHFSPYLKVQSLFPATPYKNPVERKADRNQRDPSHPYIIAVDVTELSRAHTQMVPELAGYFTIWDHLSGVLLFDYRPWAGFERKQWETSFHLNPNARIPIPAELEFLVHPVQRSLIFDLSRPASG